MDNCYLCGCNLEDHIDESTVNHFEHVIPQAIGGQLTVRDILCKTCGGHERLGGKIDKPFCDMFRMITERIDIKRDRKTQVVPLKAKLKVLEDDSEFDVHLMENVLSTQKPGFRVDHEKKRVQVFANKKVTKDYKKKVERDLLQSGEIDSRYGATIIRNLDERYETASLSEKQLIIGSVFPEKLVYENKSFRTKRMNEAIALMCMNRNDLAQKKWTK